MKKKLYAGFTYHEDLTKECADAALSGADGIVLIDLSGDDASHDRFMGAIRACAREVDADILSGGRVKRLEDVKKYIYAGSDRVYLDASAAGNRELIKEAADRFGSRKLYMYLNDRKYLTEIPAYREQGISGLLIDTDFIPTEEISVPADFTGEVILTAAGDPEEIRRELLCPFCTGVMILLSAGSSLDFMALKGKLKEGGCDVMTLSTDVMWSDIRTNADGLIPVIVQDYRNQDVLMLAYMNEEAFYKTLATGRMTYWSRSRKKLWLKGESSGHFQFVKSLTLDCDNDTLLARVFQVGAACHTGARSCFFNELVRKPDSDRNPRKVFEEVYNVIRDRKEHPKEGSYTNYLFDKGIDKILKKVGEEATEIVIAAKNPDPEEIKYELSDFLYHAMVLMVERGVTWDDITEELANRELSKDSPQTKDRSAGSQ